MVKMMNIRAIFRAFWVDNMDAVKAFTRDIEDDHTVIVVDPYLCDVERGLSH